MEKKLILIISLLILTASAGALYLASNSSNDLSPNMPVGLEQCKPFKLGQNGEVNILFFGQEAEVNKYITYFLSIAPFKEKSENFNFYYIDNYVPDCELYQGIAILCYSKELLKVAASCPNDHIVVLKPEKSEIRSSSYLNVMSININHPLSVIIHEFGHNFVNLAEEYTPAKLPSGSENCVDKCEKFGNTNNGCYEGCSESDYFRSIENGVMRTLSSSEYGVFNENLIIKKLNNKNKFSITGNAITEETICSNEEYFMIEGRYNNNLIEITNKTLEFGCSGNNDAGPFSYKLVQTNGEILTQESFNPELIFTDSPGINNGEIDGETLSYDGNFILRIQRMPNANNLEIYNLNEPIANISLTNVGWRACEI